MAHGDAIRYWQTHCLGWQDSLTAFGEDMSPELKAFLYLLRPPMRLTGEQVRWRLGMTRDEVRIISSPDIVDRIRETLPPKERNHVLSSANVLRPLGNPSAMAAKYFWEPEISRLEQDVEWLDKAARTIREYWRQKKTWKGNTKIDEREMIS